MDYVNETLTAEELNGGFVAKALPLVVLTILCSVIGTLGNLFVLYIHIFKYHQCTFRCFVLGLCAVDLVSSVILVPLEVYTYMHWYIFTNDWLCEMKAFLNLFLSYSSVYILLMIAIDRYLKVCMPHRQQLTPGLVLKCFCVCMFLSLCQSWTIVKVWSQETYTKIYQGDMVEFSMCNSVTGNFVWSLIFIMASIPTLFAMLAMVVIYILVGKKIFGVLVNMKQQSTRKKTLRRMHQIDTNQLNERQGLERASSTSHKESSLTNSTFENKIRAEFQNDSLDVFSGKVLIYKVEDDSIGVTERRGSEVPSQKDVFLQKRKFEEKSSKLLLSRTSSAPTSSCHKLNIPEAVSDGPALRKYGSSPTNTADLTSDSSESETIQYEGKPDTPIQGEDKHHFKDKDEDIPKTADNNIAPVAGDTMRRKSIFARRVKFKLSAREKLKRRTLITFIFTFIFIVTSVTNIVLHSRMTTLSGQDALASHESVLVSIAFFKLYFINYVIHPILYGILDPRFRKCTKQASKQVVGSVFRGFDVSQAQ